MGATDSKSAAPLQLTSWSENEQGILKDTFTKLLPSPPQNKHPLQGSVSSFKAVFSLIPEDLCEIIYLNFTNNTTLEAPLTFALFVDGLSRVLKNNNSRLAFYLSLFGTGDKTITSDTLAKILHYDAQLWFKLANIERDEEAQDEAALLQQTAQQICEDIIRRQPGGGGRDIDLGAVEKWAVDNLVNLGDGCAYALQKCAGLDRMIPFVFPTSLFQSHILISRMETYLIYTMMPHPKDKRKYAPATWNFWTMLYSTQQDGMSISRFTNKALDYRGPTVLLVRDSGNHLFGAYISAEWKISPSQQKSAHFQESPGCFLFSLVPCIQRFDASGVSNNHVILMCDSLMRGGGLAEVIGFGGQIDFYRMCIYEGVTKGCCRSTDTSYKQGNLLRGLGDKVDDSTPEEQNFEIVGLELWGGGGEDVYARQHEQKIRDDQLAIRMRKVNRKLMFQGQDQPFNKQQATSATSNGAFAPDMHILEMAGVHTSHVHQADHVM